MGLVLKILKIVGIILLILVVLIAALLICLSMKLMSLSWHTRTLAKGRGGSKKSKRN